MGLRPLKERIIKTTSEIAAWRDNHPGEHLNLRGADLRHADLEGADLEGSNLRGSNLTMADLEGADLRGANLRGANLRHANLRGADLRHADLKYANLRHADLEGANLRHANLEGVDLRHADLRGIEGIEMLDMTDPRGYIPIAQQVNGKHIITSGCRRFSVEDALKHWGESYQGERRIGNRYIRAIRQYLNEFGA